MSASPDREALVSAVKAAIGWDFILGLAPEPAESLLRDPEGFVREVLFDTVLVFLANFVFTTTSIIDQAANAVIQPLLSVRLSTTGAVRDGGTAAYDAIAGLNRTIASGVADSLGVGAFPLLVVLAVLEIAITVRVARASLPALTDAAGAIPVVGSVIDGVSTFVLEFIEGGDGG